jgi:hypothetical protein
MAFADLLRGLATTVGPLSLWRADSGPPQIVFAAQYGARLRRGFVDCIPLLRRFASNREAPTSAVAAGPADYERESLQSSKTGWIATW